MYTNSLNLYSKNLPAGMYQTNMPASPVVNSATNPMFTNNNKVNTDTFTDRRQNNIAVENDRRSGIDRRSAQRIPVISDDVHQVKNFFNNVQNGTTEVNNKVDKLDSIVHNNKDTMQNTFATLGFLIPFRRIASVPDKVDSKDYLGMATALGVAAVLLPEDLRDTRDGIRQVLHENLSPAMKEKLKNKSFYENWINHSSTYDHKEFQKPFSFLKGSLLESPINKMENKFGYMLHYYDKSLIETKLGKKIRDLLKIKDSSKVSTGKTAPKIVLDSAGNYVKEDVELFARKIEGGNAFTRLIGRAMQRTTVYGVLAAGLICVPSIVRAFCKPEKTEDKLANGSKQIAKAAIGVTSTVAGIGLFGAHLAQKGPKGSVAGMAIGGALGLLLSNQINKNIKTV